MKKFDVYSLAPGIGGLIRLIKNGETGNGVVRSYPLEIWESGVPIPPDKPSGAWTIWHTKEDGFFIEGGCYHEKYSLEVGSTQIGVMVDDDGSAIICPREPEIRVSRILQKNGFSKCLDMFEILPSIGADPDYAPVGREPDYIISHHSDLVRLWVFPEEETYVDDDGNSPTITYHYDADSVYIQFLEVHPSQGTIIDAVGGALRLLALSKPKKYISSEISK